MSQKGQGLLEFLIVFFFLFVCVLGVVEVSRLLAFKNSLQAATSYVTHKIAYAQINLIQENILDNRDSYILKNSSFNNKISSEIEDYFKDISIQLISYDHRSNESESVLTMNKEHVRVILKVVNRDARLPAGIYVETQTCLPVLFAGYFKKLKPQSITVGSERVDTRTCIGYLNTGKSLPLSWFRIRVAAYAPWPAATQIYTHGLPEPEAYKLIPKENKNDAHQAVENESLATYFK